MFNLTKRQEDKQISPSVIIFAILQFFFIIIIIALIFNMNHEDRITNRENEPKTTIHDLFTKIENFPKEYVDDIEHSLTETIKQNTDNFSVPDATAFIRDESLKTEIFDRHGFGALSLIIDIPSLEQSYQIYYKYALNYENIADAAYYNNPRAILCLDEYSEIRYPNFECQDTLPPETRFRIVADYLRFFEFDDFTVSVDAKDYSIIRLNPATANSSDNQEELMVAELRNKISSLGVSAEYFNYQFLTQEDLDYKIPPRH